jgi:hypothetical protein
MEAFLGRGVLFHCVVRLFRMCVLLSHKRNVIPGIEQPESAKAARKRNVLQAGHGVLFPVTELAH